MKRHFLVCLCLTGCSSWTPNALPPLASPYQTPSAAANQATGALIGEVLASAFREPDKRRQLWGNCTVRIAAEANIATPCNQVELILLTEKGEKVKSSRIEEGKFHFTVEQGKRYRLQLKSERYAIPPKMLGPYEGGDRLTLELTRKPS